MVAELLKSVDRACQEGRFVAAEGLCREALAADPANAQAKLMHGLIVEALGDRSRALDLVREAARLAPASLEANVKLATMLRQAGRWEEAVEVCERFLSLSPGVALVHGILGLCQIDLGEFVLAEKSFRAALKLEPDFFEGQIGLGNALMKLRKPAEAAEVFRKGTALKPNSAAALSSLGGALQELGQFDDALKCFEEALALEPSRAGIYLNIAVSKKFQDGDRSLVTQMKRLLERADLPHADRRAVHYALGKALDDLGEFEEALRHVDEATRITIENPVPGQIPFDREAYRAKVDHTIRTFTKDFFERFRKVGVESELPVLIIGAPRSGTTLLDQILSSHPQIGSAGEQQYWIEHVNEAFAALQKGASQARKFANEYWDLLLSFGPGKLRVIDKMPMNYGAAGLIHTLLPHARFIHIRRHPVDTCLSLYMNAHGMPMVPYGHTRTDIVFGYQGYLREMEHWRTVLPSDRFFEVDYEAVVADREGSVRPIIDFLGLAWDDACLHHESNTRSVSTPSLWQVRQPIYSTSVERWRRYEPWLGEFRELLARQEVSEPE